MEPDKIGAAVVFGVEIGFSEATGFFKESKGRGYWMTTLNECSCPSFMHRGRSNAGRREGSRVRRGAGDRSANVCRLQDLLILLLSLSFFLYRGFIADILLSNMVLIL